MQTYKNIIRSLAGIMVGLGLCIFALPEIAFAQSYVPVEDIKLNPAFAQYASDFNKYVSDYFTRFDNAFGPSKPNGKTDSLRDLISGYNPDLGPLGATRDPETNEWTCSKNGKTPGRAYAWNDPSSPWYMAWASSTNGLPAQIPDESKPPSANSLAGNKSVAVNDSGSLRCILQDVVGWQKLQLFLQFHALLKQYISDAQQKQLSNQLLNKINAANLSWAKTGEQISQGGMLTTEPVYVTNLSQSVYNRNQRTLTTMIDQAAASPGDPVGSLELCDPLGTATQLAKNERSQAQDNRDFTTSETRCSLSDPTGPFAAGTPADVQDYYNDPNTTKGPGSLFMLGYSMNNPQDFGVTSANVVENEASRRINQGEKNYREQLIGNGGIQPTQKCSGGPDDPNCDPDLTTAVSPAAQNSMTVTSAIQDNKQQILTSASLDDTVSTSSQNAAVESNTGGKNNDGLLGFDPTALQNSAPNVKNLVDEFYDAIQNGYFDVNGDRTEWAQGAMLNIYDSMSFSASGPATAIPTGSGDNTPKPLPF